MDYNLYSSTGGVISQSPHLLNRLSKLTNKGHQYAHILRCYMEAPSIVRGKTIIDDENEQRNKAKYHTNFSLSQSSKNNSLLGSADSNSLRNGKSKREMKLSLKAENSVPGSTDSLRTRDGQSRKDGNVSCRADSTYRYSYTDRSKNSARSLWTFQEYTNDYFDLFDLPGHFNTRGVYGQRAEMTPFELKRTNSELSLSHLPSRFGSLERQNTTFKWRIRATERTEYFQANSKKVILPNVGQNKNIGVQITPGRGQSVEQFNRTVKRLRKKTVPGKTSHRLSHSPLPEENQQTQDKMAGQKTTGKKLANVSLKVDDIFEGVDALKVSESITSKKVKRMSVDVSVQTDGDYTDDASEYFLF